MTKFEVFQSITDVSKFCELLFEMCKKAEDAKALEGALSVELSEEGLQTILSIARSENYPLSLERLQ